MNMIRVWGGGFYEPDWFYDFATSWACWSGRTSCSPAISILRRSRLSRRGARRKCDYQVRRLQHHACLALWCGDNELIGALNWFEESRTNRDRYLVSYDRLNRTIEDALHAADPQAHLVAVQPVARPDELRRCLA